MSKHVYRCMCGCKIEGETIRLRVKAWQLRRFYLQLKAKLHPRFKFHAFNPPNCQDCSCCTSKFSVNFPFSWYLSTRAAPCKPAKYTRRDDDSQSIIKQEWAKLFLSINSGQWKREWKWAGTVRWQNNWVVRAVRKQHLPYKLIQQLKAYSKLAHKWAAWVRLSIISQHRQDTLHNVELCRYVTK